MSVLRLKFEKLVRDKVPDELQRDGIKLVYDILKREDRLQALKNKLVEEINELVLTQSRVKVMNELVDVCDILTILEKLHGLKLESKQISFRGRSLDFLYDRLIEIAETLQLINSESFVIVDIDIALESISAKLNISNDDLLNARKNKNELYGGFLLGIFAKYIEIDEDSNYDTVQYFKEQPKKYPVMQ